MSLKLDRGAWILKRSFALMAIFLLGKDRECGEYRRAFLLHLMLLHHWKDARHTIWKMMNSNACAFNEEAGEIAFSVLSRVVGGSMVRRDADQLTQKFVLSREQVRFWKDMGLDISPDPNNEDGDDEDGEPDHKLMQMHKKRHKIIDPDGDDVQMTVVHLKKVIRQLRQGVFLHYPEDMYKKKASASSGGGSAFFEGKKECDPAPQPYLRDTKPLMRKQWEKMIPAFTSRWVKAYDIWPEAKRHNAQPPASAMFCDVDSLASDSDQLSAASEVDNEDVIASTSQSVDDQGSVSSNSAIIGQPAMSNKRASTSVGELQGRDKKTKRKTNHLPTVTI
jgi:hypothetical protein